MNQQLYDLGITTERGIEEAIKEIDTTFDLVMIAERMGESLVLLAELLCIPLQDVATLKEFGHVQNQNLSFYQNETLVKRLSAERLLYDHFRRSLDDKIR